jgi:hypothetical protein
MLRASSNLARHAARKFSSAAAESGSGGSDMSWLLGATVAVLTAGAVCGVRSQHTVLLQQEKEWLQKIGKGASSGHDGHHAKH